MHQGPYNQLLPGTLILETRTDNSGITLKQVLERLWMKRRRTAGVVALCTVIAVIAVLVAPSEYTASIVLSPVAERQMSGQLGGAGSALSQFSGIASLAGISLDNDSRKAESLAVLQSEALTENYIRQNNLLPVLYSRKWDALHQRWYTNNPDNVPTLWKANQDFKKKVRTITTDTKTGLVTMTIEWRDAQVAARWANGLVKMTNDFEQHKAIVEAERNVVFLNGEIAKTDVVGIRQALYSSLQNEISKEMLARGNDEYAFKILDPAFAPEKRSSPVPVMWISFGFFVGLILSLVGAFGRMAWAASR
jgi:uncharacterized protein involved in exopolysaccharide biosynthesis